MVKYALLLMLGSVVLTLCDVSPRPAYAGCQINVFVENTGTHRLTVLNNTNKTGVRTGSGTWRALRAGNWKDKASFGVDPGQKKGGVYSAALACGLRRDYRVRYVCQGGAQFHNTFNAYTSSQSVSVTVRLPLCK